MSIGTPVSFRGGQGLVDWAIAGLIIGCVAGLVAWFAQWPSVPIGFIGCENGKFTVRNVQIGPMPLGRHVVIDLDGLGEYPCKDVK